MPVTEMHDNFVPNTDSVRRQDPLTGGAHLQETAEYKPENRRETAVPVLERLTYLATGIGGNKNFSMLRVFDVSAFWTCRAQLSVQGRLVQQ